MGGALALAVILAGAQAPGAGSLEIVQLNRLGPELIVESVEYRVDGAAVFLGSNELGLLGLEALPVHLGALLSGWHTIECDLSYREQGRPVTVRASFGFGSAPGQKASLRVTFLGAPRPRVHFESNLESR